MMAMGLVVLVSVLLVGAVVFGVWRNGKKSHEIPSTAASARRSETAHRDVRTGGKE